MSIKGRHIDVSAIRSHLRQAAPVVQSGTVSEVRGLVIEAHGPNLGLGDLCRIDSKGGGESLLAEVVGFRDHRMLLMPLEEMRNIAPGCTVRGATHESAVPVGDGLLGRVLDGRGVPIDIGPPLHYDHDLSVRKRPPHPLQRRRITETLATGVRAIDLFTPVGVGQRLGLFAGSGVGKSTLLGMLARESDADVNVIALVGERGREVREFIEKSLGPEGLAKSVLVVSTSDEPALVRLRCAYLATAVAEHFRDKGLRVLFLMDSVTRFAMSQREIGLSVGEAPASRGYPPSTFSLLPKLLERTGSSNTGSITAFYTVLVEGDDMNEPIADSVRGILDGHLVLSRMMATANQFPAVDVLESVSRLAPDICTEEEMALVAEARDILALYRRNEDLITIGAYVQKSNARIDRAIAKHAEIMAFLRQSHTAGALRAESFAGLREILK